MNQRDAADSATLARLDERSIHVANTLDQQGEQLRGMEYGLSEVKTETMKSRTETAEVKTALLALEARERERNGTLQDLAAWRLAFEQDYRLAAATWVTRWDTLEPRVEEVEVEIGVLREARKEVAVRQDERRRMVRIASSVVTVLRDIGREAGPIVAALAIIYALLK